MAMDAVLKQLESRIEELVKAYQTANANEAKLAAQVKELEDKVAAVSEANSRCEALEKQREELGQRLEKVLSLIDGTLGKNT
jgi:chaperonin cofactor prefoldin